MFNLKKTALHLTVVLTVLALSSCGSEKNLVIPRAVSSADAIGLKDLNLTRGDYDIVSTISESASVNCTFKNNEIRIASLDGDFLYKFKFDNNRGWRLESFQGVATMGYFINDLTEGMNGTPNPEEFSRRVAAARLISAVKDYDADGVIEPITTTMVSQSDKNTVVFTTKISAKLIKIKANN